MIGMQIICAAALCAACSSGSSSVPAPLPSVAFPSGAALDPFDAGDPGQAKPEEMALTPDGRAWAVLTNLDVNYNPAGPGFLAGVVPSTGAITLVNLGAESDGGSDDHGCLNAGAVKLDTDGNLIAACAGSFSATELRGRSVVQVAPNGGTLLHSLPAPSGIQPGAIAGGPTKIWVGDTDSTTLFSITRSTFALADGASASAPAITLPCVDAADMYLYVSDILIDGNDMFALCAGEPDGYVVQLDATSGAVKGTPQLVGATPVAMALLGDGRIAVANSVDETLALVTRGSSGPTVQRAVYTFVQSAALQDVKARGLLVYVTASGTNTVAKLDLSQTDPTKMLVGEVYTGDNTGPWSILPLDDNQAVVSNNISGTLAGVTFAGGVIDAGPGDGGN
jgi:hypothetical protein